MQNITHWVGEALASLLFLAIKLASLSILRRLIWEPLTLESMFDRKGVLFIIEKREILRKI